MRHIQATGPGLPFGKVGILVRLAKVGGALACGLALLLAACGSGLNDDGPLGNGGTSTGTVCDVTSPGGVVYDGLETFHNTADKVKITKVALTRPRNLRLAAAWVVPLPSDASPVGVGRGFPTATIVRSISGAPWARRQRIPGAVVRRAQGKESIDLVVVAKPTTTATGTAKAVDLYYEADGTHYVLHFGFGLKIVVGKRTC